jgi:sugar phosphate isomerase/epimerase
MFMPGLVSITFRKLTPEEIVALCLKAGVEGIEWGGDIHCPHGDVSRARKVGDLTRNSGLIVAAYGSYYRLGGGGRNCPDFDDVLASAVALGAPTIRVWAGAKGSNESDPGERALIVDDGLRVAELARKRGMTICLEYHANTLTDTTDSVRRLMDELDNPNIEFLWQPSDGDSVALSAQRLLEVLPRLRNVHTFQWRPPLERRPLAEGEAAWRSYINIIRESGRTADFLLEFVVNDSPDQFLEDAATLRGWLNEPA